MKKLSLLFMLLCSAAGAFAQDLIIKKNGEEINAKVLEIRPETILYKKADNLEGPTIHILKSEVFMIKYENGTKDLFTQQPQQPQKPVVISQTQPAVVKSRNTRYDAAADTIMPQLRLSGPRVGGTFISQGKLSDRLRDDYDARPFITQFGWQFETRIFTTPGGLSGLFEFVPLIGGLEQGLFLPSGSAMIGLRGASGLELGVGPNLSLAGAGLAMAVGTSFSSRYVNFPVNFAVVPSREGARYSLLVGFNYRTR